MLANNPVVTFVATLDAVRARAFYEGVLGLTFVSDDPFALVMRANGVMLRITKMKEFQPAPYTVLGWETTDIEQTADELSAKGVEFNRYGWFEQDARGIWDAPGGNRVAWFADPDGNTLSISQHA